MANSNYSDYIDLGLLIKKVWSRRKLFLYKVWPITFVLACLYIICIPRYYTTSTRLAPEMENNSLAGGTLGSIASTFGFDLGEIQTTDAITPLLYPDLMDDDGFVANLFNIRVKDYDGKIDTDYYTYMDKHQKSAWWSKYIAMVKNWFKSKPKGEGASKAFDPYNMSKRDLDITTMIRSSISITVDKKTGVISVTTKAQDRLICKTVADSVCSRLQDFITEYRTNKARVDEQYYTRLVEEARQDYLKAQRAYSDFADHNIKTLLQSVKSQEENLENDMQLKFNTYNTMSAQLQAARAKVQERTPVFTMLKGASVPDRAAGPKRMIFVIGMLILITFVAIGFILWKDIKGSLLQGEKTEDKKESETKE